MHGDLGGIVIDEVPDPVMRNAAELGPLAQGANGRLLVLGEYPAQPQADDVRELRFNAGSCACFHALTAWSTQRNLRLLGANVLMRSCQQSPMRLSDGRLILYRLGMDTPIRVTFDSNVWRPIVSPEIFPKNPTIAAYETIRRSIKKHHVLAFLAETVFTLEALKNTDRKTFFGAYRGQKKISVDEAADGSIRIGFTIGTHPTSLVKNNLYLTKHLADALQLDFKLLRCVRIGGVGNLDLQPPYFAPDDRVPIGRRQENCGICAADIESQGCGFAQIKEIGRKYAKTGIWVDGIRSAPESESKAIAEAVAEWADGDAVAAHFGYSNDYFCTQDAAIAAGSTSVFSAKNRQWLKEKYKINFVTPEELANIL